jgi:beta-phosphoglucomutase-like phosphatase (HAD superfamily)
MATAFIFDLAGTLGDSVYQHVLAWKRALDQEGIPLSVWRIHRKIGMSGGLFTNMLLRETGQPISDERVGRLRQLHAAAYRLMAKEVQPLPGACELLSHLRQTAIPWAIATSGRTETAQITIATPRHRRLASARGNARSGKICQAGSRFIRDDSSATEYAG